MSFALDKPVFMSREEFYRWCAGQPEGRYERVDGELIAMSPERFGHARTKQAIFLALLTAMAQTRSVCEVFIDSVAVCSGESDYLPDVLINCGKPPDAEQMVAPNPVVIAEVLSPSTSAVDTGGKLAAYFHIPSVAHYLIVHPTRRQVIHHARGDGLINMRILASGDIRMDPPGITIGMETIYAHLPNA